MFSIEIIRILVITLYLGIVSMIDIKKKSLSIYTIILGFVLMGILYIFSPYNPISLAGGVLIGVIIVAVSFLSRQAVGLGDGLILIIIGLCFGASTIYIFMYSLAILSVCTVVFMLIKHKRYNIEVPMIPFYLAGVIIQVIYENKIF